MRGELDCDAMRARREKLYAAAGIDMRVAGACRRKEMQANGGGMGGGQRVAATASAAGNRGGAAGARLAAISSRRPRWWLRPAHAPGLVFVPTARTRPITPRVVMLGAANFDYTEVVTRPQGRRAGRDARLAGAAGAAAAAERPHASAHGRPMGCTPNAGAGGAGGRPGRRLAAAAVAAVTARWRALTRSR